MTDDEFLLAFETCSLPREAWTHRAHVRMAWLYLGRHPAADARRLASEGIRRYNAARIGKPHWVPVMISGVACAISMS